MRSLPPVGTRAELRSGIACSVEYKSSCIQGKRASELIMVFSIAMIASIDIYSRMLNAD